MPNNDKALSALIKYGPVVYGLARQHAPELVEQARRSGLLGASGAAAGPAGQTGRATAGEAPGAAPRTSSRRGVGRVLPAAQRRRATQHARSVVDGSMLQVFHAGEPVWVVFSGTEPVGTHPHVDVPYEQLLRHADLTRAVRPSRASRPGHEPGGSVG